MRQAALLVAAFVVATESGIARTTTGSISGHVADASGAALPGVRIAAESPALQGIRTTTSTGNGDYLLPFLPAGQYKLRFELQGFRAFELQQGVSVAQAYPINVRAPRVRPVLDRDATPFGQESASV
jgi:hypothetical protein